MARLIKTEKEVEGRYEDVWLVVEEDALDQWPAGPGEVVGRPTPRITGPQRARARRYTADVQLPGMLHTAVLRSPHAYARVKSIDLSRALAAPACAAIGRTTWTCSSTRRATPAWPWQRSPRTPSTRPVTRSR